MKPLELTQIELANRLGMSLQRLNGILRGRRAVTAETALLLSRELDTSPQLWLNLQNAIDLWDAAERLKMTSMLRRSSRARSAPASRARN